MKRKPINDNDILKSYHKEDEKDQCINYKKPSTEDYGKILAKKYYDKLYKEMAIIDLSHYETGKIGMRWMTDKEVKRKKGYSICSNKKCENEKNLKTFEVNFSYVEDNIQKNALVKIRVCDDCSYKLNYKKKHKEIKNWEAQITHK